MNLSRREFLQILAAAGFSGLTIPGLNKAAHAGTLDKLYDMPKFGNASLLHITDSHAQLNPVWYREPNINLGIGSMRGNPPHLVGNSLLKYYSIQANTAEAHALTHLNFEHASKQFGKVGGYAHLKTLVDQLRSERPGALLLDGGDCWQGSATSLWTKGQDMIDASLLLGVDVMTGHWEFTYGHERVKEAIEGFRGKMDFVANNVIDTQWEEKVFQTHTIKQINGQTVAIIGQAFPYTPIANPRYLIPDWSFGIREKELQQLVNKLRDEKIGVIALLSHNGMDVDLKLASRVTGIDVILGGHTHDAVPKAIEVSNKGGKTIVTNAGSHGKFISVFDMDIKNGRMQDYRYRLLPVFSNALKADKDMQALIDKVRAPFKDKLEEKLAITESTLYRRGNFNGSFDQLILNTMMEEMDAEIAFSPGFRWGSSLLPGEAITFEDIMNQTAITYGHTTLNELSGERIKLVLEDVADNLFNEDPYYQQGGDMVRVGGLQYSMDPTQKIGKRISNMTLKGKPIDAKKNYKVAGWASVAEPVEAPAIWDVVAKNLRSKKTVNIKELNNPELIGLGLNQGFEK
ncbi:MAG: thiosulfohydrolase SoxB [Gammaproteobacteria bacterium]|nr:thiosulfohydrolase SoxB [Gammaproteobacteria bacterium]MDH5692808.1 thiosulfohydrolase SoxB [Gammaproteobacteria bacterium]